MLLILKSIDRHFLSRPHAHNRYELDSIDNFRLYGWQLDCDRKNLLRFKRDQNNMFFFSYRSPSSMTIHRPHNVCLSAVHFNRCQCNMAMKRGRALFLLFYHFCYPGLLLLLLFFYCFFFCICCFVPLESIHSIELKMIVIIYFVRICFCSFFFYFTV